MKSAKELQDRFGIPGLVRFEEGPNGFVRAAVTAPQAEGQVYVYGAHLSQYRPRGGREVLFMSEKTVFEAGKSIRGGVPVIFPWFGLRAGHPESPIHGMARTMEWTVESTRREADGSATLVLALGSSAATRAIWPHDFAIRFTVRFGSALEMTMEVRNTSGGPITFEEALHTYFAVADVREVAISGLGNTTYSDKTLNYERRPQGPEAIRFVGETDRIYLDSRTTAVLDDPNAGRRIVVEKAGSNETVVWNPWIAKAKAMADFGDEEWVKMVCIETCNCADHPVTLAPGAVHAMKAIIRAEKR